MYLGSWARAGARVNEAYIPSMTDLSLTRSTVLMSHTVLNVKTEGIANAGETLILAAFIITYCEFTLV